MKQSNRSQVNPFIVMSVMDAARQAERSGNLISHLEVGQPFSGAPKGAMSLFLKKKFKKEPFGYTESLGIRELREGVSKLYQKWYNLSINPNRIIITQGSSTAFQLAFLSLFDLGDRIILGSPGYPCYKNILCSYGLQTVEVETKIKNRFQLESNDLISNKAEGVILASPSNPTGSMLSRSRIEHLINTAEEQKIAFISDEIYHGITYKDRAISALEVSDNVYVINSFSKFFGMTGWRIGWMIVPESHVLQIERLAQNLFICASNPGQLLAIESLKFEYEQSKIILTYKKNLNYLIKNLPLAGFKTFIVPDGAFYIYVDISELGIDSMKLSKELLNLAKVAVTPGYDFDQSRGHNYIRLSFARSFAEIKDAIEKLKIWHKNR